MLLRVVFMGVTSDPLAVHICMPMVRWTGGLGPFTPRHAHTHLVPTDLHAAAKSKGRSPN